MRELNRAVVPVLLLIVAVSLWPPIEKESLREILPKKLLCLYVKSHTIFALAQL